MAKNGGPKGLEELLRTIVARMDSMQIDYALLGGLAVRVWTLPRPTYDIDLVISVETNRLPQVFDALEDMGLHVGEEYRKGYVNSLKGLPKFKAIWLSRVGDIPIDVFLVRTEYQQEAFSRRRKVQASGYSAWTLEPDDIILHKLLAGRRKDLADVEALLAVQGIGDVQYLRRWAAVLNVQEQLETFLKEMET